MAAVNRHHRLQSGHTLAQTLVGMALSMLVVAAGFALFAWLQNSHHQLQTQADAHGRLNTALKLLRERIQRGAAPELVFDSQGHAAWASSPDPLPGSNSTLSVLQARSLTPADCQGHQASTWLWLIDDFKLSTRQELVCKDSWRSNSTYQALVDGVTALQFRYAQVLPSDTGLMQWLSADQISDWRAVVGVASCVQVQSAGVHMQAASLPCTPQGKGLAWRGVAAMRHNHP